LDRADALRQFFIGRELNPSIGSLDIKSFNELRPGLILWVLIDISMACEQAMRLGGRVTDSMWLVLAFQGWYVADALYNEVGRRFLAVCSQNADVMHTAGDTDHHGHHDRRVRLHARGRRPLLGPVHVLAPGALPRVPACRARPDPHRRRARGELARLLHLPRLERREERLPEREEPEEYVSLQ
jgi:hypothetical protein